MQGVEVKAISKAPVYDVDGANLFGGNGADSALGTIRKIAAHRSHRVSTPVDTASLTNSLLNKKRMCSKCM